MLLGLQGEGVEVHTGRGLGADGLHGLHLVEVQSPAGGEPILSVQLQLGAVQRGGVIGGDGTVGVDTGGCGQGGGGSGAGGRLVLSVGGTRHDPREVLGGVVEVQTDVAGLGAGGSDGDGLVTGELDLLDQVLVRDLGETTPLVHIQVDIIHPQVGTAEGGVDTGHGGGELEVELDLRLKPHLSMYLLG